MFLHINWMEGINIKNEKYRFTLLIVLVGGIQTRLDKILLSKRLCVVSWIQLDTTLVGKWKKVLLLQKNNWSFQ